MNSLKGTGALIKLALRRDRLRLPVWILLLAGFTILIAASFPDIYPSAEDRQVRAELITNPAAKAFAGPAYGQDNYTYGAMMTNEMLGFMLIFVALMAVLLTVRHTRGEEEKGSAELVRAGAVGRFAALTSTFIVVGGASLILGILTAVGLAGLGIESMGWAGSWLFGATYAVTGIIFTAIALLCAQISEHSRAAAGIAGAVIAAGYVLRGLGDVSGTWLSWLSPFGWMQACAPYVFDRPWPLMLGLILTTIAAAAAYIFSARRDLGAGFLKTKLGPPFASRGLASVNGIARHLQRTSFMWWVIGLGLFALLYGTLVGEVETFVEQETFIQDIFAATQNAALIDSFLATIILMFAMGAAVYAILTTNKLRNEEAAGRSEPILTTATSRWAWAISHLGIALIGSTILLIVSSMMLGISAAISLGDSDVMLKLIGAALAYIPAVWTLAGIAVFLFGCLPRLVSLVWIVLAYGATVGILGGLLGLPKWAYDLSPFAHVPLMPAEPLKIAPLAILGAVALLLIITGLALFRSRDLSTN